MASNYNGLTRPAAVLVADGEARLIRRRETLEEILGLDALEARARARRRAGGRAQEYLDWSTA